MARKNTPGPAGMLVFCTAYAQTTLIWQRRYRRWVDAVMAAGLGQQQIVLIDDGSPVLPGWPDTDVVTLRSLADAASVSSSAPVLLLRFPERLGRSAIYDFPGWYRSFACGARYALSHGYDRVVHLESDAYLISERLRAWVRETRTGWATLWCGKYDMPEIAVQLIGADQLDAFDAFTRKPYKTLAGQVHETSLPFTHVERGFTGDRYGEDMAMVPADADFATQVPSQREPAYYWWLNGEAGPAASEEDPLAFDFVRGGTGAALQGDGWARPEPHGTWMINALSVLNLPPLPPASTIDLVFNAVAHVRREFLPVQRLTVQANAAVVGHFDFTGTLNVGLEIPARLLRRDGTDKVRFIHPDAARPRQTADKRMLSLMLTSLILQPREGAQTEPET